MSTIADMTSCGRPRQNLIIARLLYSLHYRCRLSPRFKTVARRTPPGQQSVWMAPIAVTYRACPSEEY
eukprot:1262623-Pyramimonas_sp.AAC.1